MKGDKDCILVLNRGYGKGKYNLNYAIIDIDNYLIENHLICIKDESIDKLNIYESIIKSFNDKRTKIFTKLYFGNNAINIKELYEILPIYIV